MTVVEEVEEDVFGVEVATVEECVALALETTCRVEVEEADVEATCVEADTEVELELLAGLQLRLFNLELLFTTTSAGL